MKIDLAKKYALETLAIHAGQAPDPTTGAIMTPIYQTSTYVQAGPGEHKGYEYSRTQNPTRHALEGNLAALEGGAFGLAFASGSAAMATILHTLSAGDHVVCGDDVYGGTFRMLDKVFKQLNVTASFVDLTDPAALDKAFTPQTKLLWVETPTNPLLKILDLSALAERARNKGVLSVCDNTFATPYFQRPLEHGFDVVVHSTTKYLGGHSDVVGGVAIVNDRALSERLAFLQNAIGAVCGPFDAWLVMRGTKTLHLRMQRHAENAQTLAEWLSKHADVERVIYPGLPSHPQHALAKRQMRGFGGMVTFTMKGDLERARRFLKSTQLFACAESLGGVESLIEHPAIMTHASIGPENRKKLGISDTMIRASVGVEAVVDLQADLEQAFARSKG
ncbi:MAG: cystathionine gamma-synthase [Deltaproteobacteria bacterium]|nr:cystathionine gamma-synthase [Deltaproteobacteria bacterium]